jgi:hypothetical protein
MDDIVGKYSTLVAYDIGGEIHTGISYVLTENQLILLAVAKLMCMLG